MRLRDLRRPIRSFIQSKAFPTAKSNFTTKMSADAPAANVWVPPPKIEALFAAASGNQFASINAPTSGARTQKAVPVGSAPFQLYSLATPNGMKPAIMLEELGIDYDAHKILLNGEQFISGFVDINPNSKIPAAVDLDGPGGKPINLFESASIVLYLADKYKRFIPEDFALRTEVMNWVFWQMGGQGPMCGNFGHFFVYAPADKVETRDYGTARYGMEVQRLCSVLNTHLSTRTYMVGEEYTIADIVIFPWARQLMTGYPQPAPSTLKAKEFLSIEENYPHMVAWINRVSERPAVQRGITVCSFASPHPKPWLAPAEAK